MTTRDNEAWPRGPEVPAWPRPLPARTTLRGAAVVLEPLHRRHSEELWQASQAAGGEASFTYLGYGPFADQAAMERQVCDLAAQHDPMAWAIRPVATGRASGWLTLMDIQPRHATIELGHIWLAPVMQRTRAATEAMVLLLRLAAEELGYRRLTWKCDSRNAPSRRAAARLGFTFEGILRAHMVNKGRLRDTAYFSIVGDEWPSRRDAMLRWLADENFDAEGRALTSLRAGEA